MPFAATLPQPLTAVASICYPADSPRVVATTAQTLSDRLGLPAPRAADRPLDGLRIALADGSWSIGPSPQPDWDRPWLWAQVNTTGEGEITASEPALLYAWAHWLCEGLTPEQQAALSNGLLCKASFSWNRPLFDTTLTQVARTTRRFDAEAHVERMARCGFTHLEVNGLAFPEPREPGTPNEFYSPFYTYCPGLNQFVDSPLTRGVYDPDYLQANLNRLKHLAALGRRYGLKPGLLCFEPRTLPESFFQRYPTLRGARVDHPFRSHLPRYTLAQDHPVARDHYRYLMQRLMDEAPDLAYLSIWTNDSGAGFEHTASLYVGRNGGPYLIREWRSHEQIAEAAGESALRWLWLLEETAAEVNPEFEVLLRIEPFKVEHDTIMAGMGGGLSVEAPSLLVRGYDLPYRHPRYPDQTGVAGSMVHVDMDEEAEGKVLARYRQRGIEPKLSYSVGSSFNMEPLLGIPFPRMLHRKLRSLHAMDARCVSALGGLLNTEKTPFWPNPEVIRAFQMNPARPIDEVIEALATRWAGADYAEALAALWNAVEETVSYFPIVPLYSHFGFVWLRTWVRPLVPNLEAVPRDDRRYFERFMVSTANNPNINDLGRDVLFELISRESGRQMRDQFDTNVLPHLQTTLDLITTLTESTPAPAVFTDLRDRIRALRCWATTQRNTCAWVAGVYGYLEAKTKRQQSDYAADIQAMIDLDLANTRDLLDLWENSETEVILVSDVGETSFIYGENFGELLRRKIELTEAYRYVEPHIDYDIIWRLV